jgi:acetoin utilization deacetylase AcuC-like enzyme
MHRGLISAQNLYDPGLIPEEVILMTHTTDYWHALKTLSIDAKMIRKVGFPLSDQLIKRSMSSAMGTLMATKYALENGISFNAAGGTHHAYADRGEGFCLLNDIAIAANYYLCNKLVSKVLVIDLDVHQGNGTAHLFRNNKQVFTFSMHGKDNYPLHKETSDLDIAFSTGTTDQVYLDKLEEILVPLITEEKPELIYYQAGVDVLASDKLGYLSLSLAACKQRDRMVFMAAKQANIPIVVTMGGGYSVKISDIVDAHFNTYVEGFAIFDN